MWLGHPVPGRPWSVPLHVLRRESRSRLLFDFESFAPLPLHRCRRARQECRASLASHFFIHFDVQCSMLDVQCSPRRLFMWLGHPVPGRPWSVPLHVLRRESRSRLLFDFESFAPLPLHRCRRARQECRASLASHFFIHFDVQCSMLDVQCSPLLLPRRAVLEPNCLCRKTVQGILDLIDHR